MDTLLKKLTILLISGIFISNSHAENNVLYESDTAYLSGNISTQAAFFTQNNSWFGKAQENIGHNDNSWWEATIEPGLKGHFVLPSDSQLFYELSYFYAKTMKDDASGETVTLDDPGHGELEQGYIGWRSGKMFSLADDLLELSLGQQDYKLGNGFLLWTGGSAGYKNGAWWIGSRHAFQDSAIVKINTGAVKTDIFRLKNRPQSGSAKDMRGFNFEYLFKQSYNLGFTYIKVQQNHNPSIDGADILDFRLDINDLSALPAFSFMGEYVKEDNGSALDSQGWYSQFAWQFDKVNWTPQLSYRYAALEGDDPDTHSNEAFDPLRYGFADWNSWYQGEIIGEYVLGNSNLNTHMLKLNANPLEDLTLNLFYFRFYSDQAQSRGISSDHYADEIDLIADWSVNDAFSLSAVIAIAEPGDGAEEHTGGDKNWLLGMIYGSYKF
ncbi:MAG: alginate export family protein [gamma proteobacterium symbiont of Taylorina sp.]|nr:alginate export family protein [gamma proteobacterium symbiont of Taylorina sp.]